MLRQSIARSAWRTGKQAVNASRAFSLSAHRQAEVEVTIGMIPPH
jgi:NADH dehydrogenase (ubiquinone) Fe-S protein 1